MLTQAVRGVFARRIQPTHFRCFVTYSTLNPETEDIKQHVTSQLKDGHITMFTKINCHECKSASNLLERLRYPHTDIQLDDLREQDVRNALIQYTGQRTTPFIFFGRQHIGGYKELKDLESKGELEAVASENHIKHLKRKLDMQKSYNRIHFW